MNASLASETVSVEQRYSDDGCEFGCQVQYEFLGLKLLSSVLVRWIRSCRSRVGSIVSVEDLIARNVKIAGEQMASEKG